MPLVFLTPIQAPERLSEDAETAATYGTCRPHQLRFAPQAEAHASFGS